jgi:hypothetical protein
LYKSGHTGNKEMHCNVIAEGSGFSEGGSGGEHTNCPPPGPVLHVPLGLDVEA